MSNTIGALEISAKGDEVGIIQGLLAQHANFGWQEKDLSAGGVAFVVQNDNLDFLKKLMALAAERAPDAICRLEQVDKKDWAKAWREFFTPVECGNLFVVQPPWRAHMEHSRRKTIVINPAAAFGTGHHASTRLCLAALSDLAEAGSVDRGGWFLDLGCGSGVLAIAAFRLGMDGTALDIDPLAIANARENRELNEAEGIEFLTGGIEKVKKEKFDLVMANILARPLIELAPQICAALKKKSCLILGGILADQAPAVAEAYKAQGLTDPEIMAEDEWRALIWKGIEQGANV